MPPKKRHGAKSRKTSVTGVRTQDGGEQEGSTKRKDVGQNQTPIVGNDELPVVTSFPPEPISEGIGASWEEQPGSSRMGSAGNHVINFAGHDSKMSSIMYQSGENRITSTDQFHGAYTLFGELVQVSQRNTELSIFDPVRIHISQTISVDSELWVMYISALQSEPST